MEYLVDTSAWIRHFSRKDGFDLRSYCEPEDRILCLPIYQEILQGIRDESTFRTVNSFLDAARFVEDPLERVVFREAAGLYRLARRQGVTIRSVVDCLIAACAIRNDIAVLHSDRDFSQLSKISTLRETNVGESAGPKRLSGRELR